MTRGAPIAAQYCKPPALEPSTLQVDSPGSTHSAQKRCLLRLLAAQALPLRLARPMRRGRIEMLMAEFIKKFDCSLTSMTGIEVVTAAGLLSCIGDIKKFSSPAKLARYSGVAPETCASGKKDIQFANQRGNRELHTFFYGLAVRLVGTVGSTNKVINTFFYEYYHKKISEGKTKRQALKCVERRLVNIIWTMLTSGEEYINPPMYSAPKKNGK